MKNIYKILVLILLIGVSACKDSDESAEDSSALSVVETNISFPAAGGNDGYIKVNVTDDYTATSGQSWCTLSLDKDVIKISATANLDLGSRAALVTITSGNQKKEVSVYQHGAILTLDKTDLFFEMEDGPEYPQKVNVTTNVLLIATVADPWVTATFTGDTLTVYCNSASLEARSTTVTVSAGENVTAVINVTQAPPSYESYLGQWSLTGIDIFSGEEYTFPNIVIRENVPGESYIVDGWYAWGVFANMEFVMDYDPETKGVSIVGLQYSGSYSGYYDIYFMAVIYEPLSGTTDGLDYLYNDVAALKGTLKRGKITWEYQTVFDYYYRSDYTVLGMSFFLYDFYFFDDVILNDAVLTRK
jgi:hypothetical protein